MPENWHICVNKGITYLLTLQNLASKRPRWLLQKKIKANAITKRIAVNNQHFVEKIIDTLTQHQYPVENSGRK